MTSFLPAESSACVISAARLHFTEEVFLEWLESISRVPYLESELGQLPATFESTMSGAEGAQPIVSVRFYRARPSAMGGGFN